MCEQLFGTGVKLFGVFLMLSLYHTVSVFSILIDRNLLLGKKWKKNKKQNKILKFARKSKQPGRFK